MMSKIKAGSIVEIISTSKTKLEFGLTSKMPISGRFVVKARNKIEVELIGATIPSYGVYYSYHIKDLKLVDTPENIIRHLKQENRELSDKRNNLFSRMCDLANAMTFIEDSKKLNKISEKIGSNGLKIRQLREKIKK